MNSNLLLDQIRQLPEYDDHQFLMCQHDKEGNLDGFIAIHRRGKQDCTFGATRYWTYDNPLNAARDALHLSKTMSYKAALAGLNYGGAKGVIIKTPKNQRQKRKLLKAYAQNITFLKGGFITGADVGISSDDVKFMRRVSPYMVGIHYDPVRFTSHGLYVSLQATNKVLFDTDDIAGRSFAIQGIGKVGASLIERIYQQAQSIYVSDVNQSVLRRIKKQYPEIIIVEPEEIYSQSVDYFSPCALGKTLNEKNIKKLQCKAIVGSANGQLENPSIGKKLQEQGILYAPDYVVNAGGLISVVDEYENKIHSIKRVSKRVDGLYLRLKGIYQISESTQQPTNVVADNVAKDIIDKYSK